MKGINDKKITFQKALDPGDLILGTGKYRNREMYASRKENMTDFIRGI